MKLRLRANTIRLRLLQAEVQRLSQGETITETLPTPIPFGYSVKPADVSDLSAHFDHNTLTVQVPRAWSAAWATNDEVGRAAVTQGLDILIEKDWACTTPRQSEDESGAYPNPTRA
jgi:hypothetical protein